jgi:arylsulfatase A-like enzyme
MAWLAIASLGCDARAPKPPARPAPARPNVLVITIDTLRADHLSCYGYPRPTSPDIDRLAAEGALFSSVTAQRGQTWPSLTSIMTGKYPLVHGVRTNGQRMAHEQETLASALKAAGYETGAFLTNMIGAVQPGIDSVLVCRLFGLPQWKWDDRAVAGGIAWIRTRPAGAPWFAWIHMIDPHMPYEPKAPLDTLYRRGAPAGPPGTLVEFGRIALGGEPLPAATLDHFVGLYDGQINRIDAKVGEIVAALDSLGERERTMIVVSADHGEDLFERNRYFGHSCSVYSQTLQIPLIVWMPARVRATLVDEPVESIDILPTVLDLVGLAAPAGAQGRSRAARVRHGAGSGGEEASAADAFARAPADTFETLIEWTEEKPGARRALYALRTDRWKLVTNPEGHRVDNDFYTGAPGPGFVIAAEELYDLSADPGERRNVAHEYPEVAARLRARLAERVRAAQARALGEAPASDSLDAETADALRALGYVR